MLRRILTVSIVLVFLVAVVAMAVQQVPGERGNKKPQWWPGEGPVKNAPRDVIQGTVTHVDANRIAIHNRMGEFTFAVTQDTKVVVEGKLSKIAEVKSGDFVLIKAGYYGDGAVWAMGIAVPQPKIVGKITALSRNGFVLTDRAGKTWNVTLDPEVKIVSNRYAGSIDDLRVGYTAGVIGIEEGNEITALRVRFTPTVIKGVIEQVNNNTLTVKTLRQLNATVNVTDSASILIRPRTAPNVRGSLADLKAGMAVNIGGHITSEAVLEALWIDVLVGTYEGGKDKPATEKPAITRPGVRVKPGVIKPRPNITPARPVSR